MGVGPWFYIDRVKTDYFRHRGKDFGPGDECCAGEFRRSADRTDPAGNDAPSMYKEFLDFGREGLQHMSYWTRDYQTLYDRALSLGYKVGHEGQIGGEQGRFAYFDTQIPSRHRGRDIRHQRQQGQVLRAHQTSRRWLGWVRADP